MEDSSSSTSPIRLPAAVRAIVIGALLGLALTTAALNAVAIATDSPAARR
jgi:hypothetical protein